VIIEGLQNGTAVMYLAPLVIDSMASEILRLRKKLDLNYETGDPT
jgi:hypothetical protein